MAKTSSHPYNLPHHTRGSHNPYRTQSHIPATFRAISTPKARARNCIVANHSSGGLMLMIDEEVPVKTDDRIVVCYRPQADIAQEIERVVTVRHYQRGRSIGGAFLDAPAPAPLMAGLPLAH